MRRRLQVGSPLVAPLIGYILASCTPSPGVPTTAQPEQRPPNVVFIIADDLGYGDVGVYGQQKIRTPRLDQMAREGTRFTHFYAGSPVCAPSRSALMTGQHTGHTPIRGNKEVNPIGQEPLPAEAVTVAEVLKAAGYTTGAFGKWGLGGPGSEGAPTRQGFDEFFGELDNDAPTSTTPISSSAVTSGCHSRTGLSPLPTPLGQAGPSSAGSTATTPSPKRRSPSSTGIVTGPSSSTYRSPSLTPSCRHLRTRTRRTWTRAGRASSRRHPSPEHVTAPSRCRTRPMPPWSRVWIATSGGSSTGCASSGSRRTPSSSSPATTARASKGGATRSSSTATVLCVAKSVTFTRVGSASPCLPGARVASPRDARAITSGRCGTYCPR